MKRWALLLTTVFIVLGIITGCSSGSDAPAVTGGGGEVLTITVDPPEAVVDQGETQTFTAIVTGTGDYPRTVTWSIVETDIQEDTVISPGGVLTVSANEPDNTRLTIKATTTLAGSSVFGTAAVRVVDLSVPITVTGITVTPEQANVGQGGEQAFTATVQGTGNYPDTVTWSIVQTDINAGTAIDEEGVLTVAEDEEIHKTLTIKAVSTYDANVFGEATVIVVDPHEAVTVTRIDVTPAEVNVNQGASHEFTATVYGTGVYPQEVIWSIVETDVKEGTGISAGGTLLVAGDETAGKTLTIKAVTVLGGSDTYGTAIVTVTNPSTPITVTRIDVTPPTPNVYQGDTQLFTATVHGTGAYPTSVNWTIVQTDIKAGTSISTNGLLTVAGDETAGRTLTIKAATTLEGSDVSGTATVTVVFTPPAKIWLVGDITNWLNGNGKTPIELNKEANGTFTWTGDLTAGYLKFNGNSTSPTDYNTGTWYRPSENVSVDCATLNDPQTLNYSTFTTSGNANWQIINSGTYAITVNPANSSVTFVRTAELVVNAGKVWLVGDVTNWLTGTGGKTPIEMTPNNDGTFTWSGDLAASSYLKFNGEDTMPTTATENSSTWYRPTSSNTIVICAGLNEPENSSFDVFTSSGMPSWSITYAGTYTITVDPANKTATFTRTDGEEVVIEDGLSVWLVGAGVTPTWTIPPPDGLKMTPTETTGVFTWTGNLATSATEAVSFVSNKGDADTPIKPPAWSGGGKWFVAADSSNRTIQNVNTPQIFSVVENSNQNPMWGVVSAAAGNFTITLDTVNMTVTFVKN